MTSTKKTVYFDAAAANKPDLAVSEFFLRSLKEDYYNPEAAHLGAYYLRKKLEVAETKLSQLLTGSSNYKIIWGNSATGLFQLFGEYIGKKSIITTSLEHPALKACLGNNISKCSHDNYGQIKQVENSHDISVTHWIQSELGIMQKQTLKAKLRFIDAVQGCGKKFPLPPAEIIVISGVKYGAPGGAAMLVNSNSDAAELIDFSKKKRSSHQNERISIPMALALTYALELRLQRWQDDWVAISLLNRQLREQLRGLHITPTIPFELSSPYILHAMLPEQQGAVIVRMLSERGIYVASSSACEAESPAPSSALQALGFSPAEAYRGLRISFPFQTTIKEVEYFIDNLEQVLKNY